MNIVNFLVDKTDCIIDHENFMGETALFQSMKCNSNEPAIKLITAGADLNIASNLMVTPLHAAVKNKPDVVKLLIEQGADINAASEDCAPLHIAVEEKNYEIVCMLLYYGADASIRNDRGFTPFMLAAFLNTKLEIQELLLEYEVDVNLRCCHGFNNTLLLAMYSQSPICLDLIDRGADLHYSRGISNVVNFLFTYSDNSIFEKIWHKLTPCLIEELKVEIIILFEGSIPDDVWPERIKMVLFSDKAEVLVRKHSDILNYLIPGCHHHKMTESEVFPLLCTCLMFGAEVTYNHVRDTFHRYGYKELLKFLLQIGVTVTCFDESFELPYFVCHVAPYAPENYKNCNVCNLDEPVILLKYITYMYMLCKKCKNRYVQCRMQPPTLREWARLATRRTIALRYGTKNTMMFYTIVNKLDVPDIIKRLIGYEIPITY